MTIFSHRQLPSWTLLSPSWQKLENEEEKGRGSRREGGKCHSTENWRTSIHILILFFHQKISFPLSTLVIGTWRNTASKMEMK